MMTSYILITGIVVIIFILLDLIKTKPKKKTKSALDELNENPIVKEMRVLFEVMSKLNQDGTDQDAIPGGYGNFGYDKTNPIPVNTVYGNIAYLARLRTENGDKVEYERIGSTYAPNSKNPIDIYEISFKDEKLARLFLSPYNKRNSERAPDGFKIESI